jgi:type II secretory pathway pseudopilin PulG
MHKNHFRDGFALIELLVILAILAMFSGMLMPVVSRAKADRTTIGCENNGRQLMLAMHLYAADFSELLPPNEDNNNQFNGWVAGDMTVANQATNTVFLTDPRYAKLAKYTAPDPMLYRCSADTSTVQIAGKEHARVRSVSMNQAVGTVRDGKSPVDGPWLNEGTYANNNNAGPYRAYGKLSSMVHPAPDKLWVFTDEDPGGINDGAFAFTMHENPTAAEWIDWPATYHRMGCGLAFADGHAEIHHWLDARTPVKNGNVNRSTQPDNLDIRWVMERTSAKR